MVWAPTFFGHTKFEVKYFSEFFPLPSTLVSEFFLVSEGGVFWALTCFWSLQISGQKIIQNFFLYHVLRTLNFSEGGSGHQLFLVTPNLRSNIFQNFFLYQVLWSLNLSGEGVLAPTFLVTANVRSKNYQNFFLYRALWTLNFLVLPNLRSKIFQKYFLYQVLWTLNFLEGEVCAPIFFGHSKFEVKNFSEFFPLLSSLVSEFVRGGVFMAPTFFGHTKCEVKKFSEFFPLRSALDYEFFGGGSGHQLFWVMPNLRSRSFQNFLDSEILVVGGYPAPTFFGHPKFVVKNFFLYQALWSLNFSWFGVCPGNNFVWSLQI